MTERKSLYMGSTKNIAAKDQSRQTNAAETVISKETLHVTNGSAKFDDAVSKQLSGVIRKLN